MPRWAKITLGIFGALVLLIAGALLVITQTDFGRERVRALALGALEGSVAGIVDIGEISGNLLSGATLHDVVITDSAGGPFLEADSISLGYSLGGLLSQKILLSDVRLVDPTIVLDKRPGEDWNFARIFPSDTTAQDTAASGGFGSWVRIDDLSIARGRLLVRTEWEPDSASTGAVRDSAIASALSPESRLEVVRVANGFQSVQEFRDLDARLPLLRLAHPDSADIRIDVAQLKALALPFRPPAAQVEDLQGRFVIGEDSIRFDNVRLVLPGSRLAAEGAYAKESGDLRVAVRTSPLRLADLQWFRPSLPDSGGGSLQLSVVRQGERTHIIARDIDVRIEGAELAGHAEAQIGDSLRLGDTDLRFAGIDTRLIQRLAPDAEVPVDGTASGRLALSGDASALDVDGTVTFQQPDGSTSRLVADGVVGTAGGGFSSRNLRLRLDPLQLALARRFRPDLDLRGALSGQAVLSGSTASGFDLDADLVHAAPGSGRSRLLADGRIQLADGFAADNLTLRFQPVQVALARTFAPDLPLGGTIAGRTTLNGTPDRLRIDADLTHRDAQSGRSRVLANGVVSTADGFQTPGLELRFDPLQVALVRAFSPDFPLDGTLEGRATVRGAANTRLAAALDLTHEGPTGVSRLIGDVRAGMTEPRRFDVDLRAPTLALETVGAFAPAADLRGTASGAIAVRGTLDDLDLALDLTTAESGSIALLGSVDLQGIPKRYDVDARFASFDAGGVAGAAPRTALTGTISLEGRGTDPATMNATLSADLTDTRVTLTDGTADSVSVDAAQLLVRIAGGLAAVEQGTVRLASAQADIEGSFGLAADRSGTLRYRIAIDSLSDFAQYVPADTTAVEPRTAEIAQVLAEARADSARIAQATEVERAATGQPAEPVLEVDSVPALPRDSLAGSLQAEGVIAGNLERFDLRGTAQLERVIALGNALNRGRIRYDLEGVGTPALAVEAEAALDSVRAGGFALDSVTSLLSYTGGGEEGAGTAQLTIYQDPDRDYRLRADYLLGLDRKEILLDDVLLRFDTTRWTSTQPGRVRWGGSGVEVETLSLSSEDGGRIFVDGTLPAEGDTELTVDIEGLQVGQVAALLQDSAQVQGLFSLRAQVDGTAAAPRIEGETSLAAASYAGNALPGLRATFNYAANELDARALLLRDSATVVVADARLPVNLALSGVEGSRMIGGPLTVDVRADSLPVDALDGFTDALANVQGRASGNLEVRGTWEQPDVDGRITLDLGSADVVTPGLELRNIAGLVRIQESELILDSLVAYSGGGPIRVAGQLDISELSTPAFDLEITTQNARVLDNYQGRLRASAALDIEGPYDRVAVTGTATVREGVIYIPESDETIMLDEPLIAAVIDSLVVAPGVVPEPNALLENLRVDVDLRIDRNTWVRSAEANVEIYSPDGVPPLHVEMDRQRRVLTLDGVVNTDRGEYNAVGRRFEIATGTVVMLGGPELDPLLQLTAVHEVPRPNGEGLAIQLHIGGNLSDPTLTLDSDAQPPLSQTELLSYLVFGRSSSSLMQQGGSGLSGGGSGGLPALATQQLAGLALGALLEGAVSNLEQEASRSGLDVFRIFPADDLPEEAVFGGNFGNALRGTQIEAGKYVTRRLFVAGQGRPTTDSWPGLRVEYRTPSGFRWVTTWEPRYLPRQPSFIFDDTIDPARVFGLFLLWERRF